MEFDCITISDQRLGMKAQSMNNNNMIRIVMDCLR